MDSTEPWEELDPDDWKGSTEGHWESEGEEWKSTEAADSLTPWSEIHWLPPYHGGTWRFDSDMQNNYGAPWHVYPEYWLYLRSTG